MGNGNEEYYSRIEIVTGIRLFVRELFKKWWLFSLFALLGLAVGLAYHKWQKATFEAECIFILEEKQGGLGGLSSLAGQFGFDVSGLMGGGSIFAGDNVLEILKSRRIVEQVLLSKADSGDAKNNQKLIDLFLAFSGWKQKWQNNKFLSGIHFENAGLSGQPLSLLHDSVVHLSYKQILKRHLGVERVTRKGSIMKVVVTAEDPVFAKLMSERIVRSTLEMYVQYKTNNAGANVASLERKADSLLRLLNRKTYQAAGSVVVDANPGLRSAVVPAELNTRDKVVLQTLYGEVTKNLEISRLALSQQTPIIQLLDVPAYPLENKKAKLIVVLPVAVLLSLFLAFGWLLLRYLIRPAAKTIPPSVSSPSANPQNQLPDAR